MLYLPTSARPYLAASLMAAGSVLALSGAAAAQTIVLNHPTQVTDTTIRSGSYANTNLDDHSLITRRSSDPDFERRSLLKVGVEDAGLADEVMSTLMGDEVELRKQFIQQNAKDVRFLDI